MAAPITAGAQQNDFTTRLVVGAHYDWSNGLIIPNPRPDEGEANSTPYIDRVVWRHPHVSGAGRAHWDLLTFPPPTRDPHAWLHGSQFFNGLCFVIRGGGTKEQEIALVGVPLEVWTGSTLIVTSRWRDIRFKETRQLLFLPEDITEAPADHRVLSKYTGIHQVSPVHTHALLEQGVGKAHDDHDDLETRVKALEDAG